MGQLKGRDGGLFGLKGANGHAMLPFHSRRTELLKNLALIWIGALSALIYTHGVPGVARVAMLLPHSTPPRPPQVALLPGPRKVNNPILLDRDPMAPTALAFRSRAASQHIRLGPAGPDCFSAERAEPNYDTVLLLAQGRSGSTSLLRLLNSLPCTNIKGETSAFHRLIGRGAFRARVAAEMAAPNTTALWSRTHWSKASLENKPAWFHRVVLNRVDRVLELLVSDMLEHVPGKLTSGWKSIINFLQSYEESVQFVDDWVTLYPRTLVVMLTRRDAEKSGWWRLNPTESILKLTKQRTGFRRFAGEIRAGRYLNRTAFIRGTKVGAVELDYGDVVGCQNLDQLYAELGHTFDKPACEAIMGVNVEDYGVAASEYDFSADQGRGGWEYGFRAINPRLAIPAYNKVHKLTPFGPFSPTNATVDRGTGPREHVAYFDPQGKQIFNPNLTDPVVFNETISLSLGPGIHVPTLFPDLGHAACRRWTSHTTLKARVDVTAPNPIETCGSGQSGFAIGLLVDAQPVRWKFVPLGQPNSTSFKQTMDLKEGTKVELCVWALVEQGEPRVCGGFAAAFGVVRDAEGKKSNRSWWQ